MQTNFHMHRLLTTALLCLYGLLRTCPASAQIQDITAYDISDQEDYRAYPIVSYQFADIGRGYVAAGNRTAGSDHSNIHLMLIPQQANANTARGYKLQYAEEDVRVIAVTVVDMNRIALTVQARSTGVDDHILVTVIDCNMFMGIPAVVSNLSVVLPERNLYPLSAAKGNAQRLYISGFSTNYNSPNYPLEPEFVTTKSAMIAEVDLSGTSNTRFRLFNTPQNTTPPHPTSGWNGTITDYDAFMRVSFRNNRIFVGGSANGTGETFWTVRQDVNTSKIWAAELDPATLQVVNESFFGELWATTLMRPDQISGWEGLDILDDPDNPGEFNMVVNTYDHHSWGITHLDANLQLPVLPPGLGSTITYNAVTTGIKAYGGFMQGSTNRINLFGLHLRGAVPMAYNAVPFTLGLDISYSPGTGSTFTNPAWYIDLNSAPAFATFPLFFNAFWLGTDLMYWSQPVLAAQADPANGMFNIATMGHYQSTNVVPRFIQGDADGWVAGCSGSQPADPRQSINDIYVRQLEVDGAISTSTGTSYQISSVAAPVTMPSPFVATQCSVPGQSYRNSSPTGTGAVPQRGDLQIYPSPVRDQLTVQWSADIHTTGKTTLEILDMSGKSVLKLTNGAVSGRLVTYKLPPLAAGMYMAAFTTQGAARVYQKIVVN